jgi:hypothetical protein
LINLKPKLPVAREQAPSKRREGGNDHHRRIIQALTSMLVTDTVKLLHYGRVVHFGRLVKVKDFAPRQSLEVAEK